MTDVKNKWNNIYSNSDIGDQLPSKILEQNRHLLPLKGKALDVACGKGSDAIFLAKAGLEVDAWDISDAVIDKINVYAKQEKLSIMGESRDITMFPPDKNTYDVICVAHFLERELMPILIESLKPNGLIFYQTFSKVVTPSYTGPGNPSFRLDEGELLGLFSGLQLVVYREEGLLGDIERGFRNEVMYIGKK